MKLVNILEFEDQPKEYRIYVDMDGVIADFERKLSELLGEPFDNERFKSDKKYKNATWKVVSKHQKQGGEVWYELEPMADTPQLWNYIAKYNPEILSATGSSHFKGKGQKERWIKKHFGPSVRVNIVTGANDKQQFAAPNHILIDDSARAINPWVAAGGIGILHTSATNTIQQLKKLGI